ncbi:MAG: hypothetical protein RIE74_20665, partial [Pseudomonadales bacterium]
GAFPDTGGYNALPYANDDSPRMDDDSSDESLRQQRDDVRCDAALQTLQDVLWRFNETNEGTLSAYDVIGYLVEDLIQSGFCAACISESVEAAFERCGADRMNHKADDESGIIPRTPDDVFH